MSFLSSWGNSQNMVKLGTESRIEILRPKSSTKLAIRLQCQTWHHVKMQNAILED